MPAILRRLLAIPLLILLTLPLFLLLLVLTVLCIILPIPTWIITGKDDPMPPLISKALLKMLEALDKPYDRVIVWMQKA